jgi:chromosome partitioning protein
MDPQASATSSIFGNREFESSTYDIMMGNATVKDVVAYSEEFDIHVIPSNIILSGVEIQLAQKIGREKTLNRVLRDVQDFDLILIDAPPSLGLLTVNSVTASDEVVICICPEYFSLKGVKLFLDTLEQIRENLDVPAELAGILITRYRERVVTRKSVEIIRTYFKDNVFKTVIPENIAVEEAHNSHLPLWKYAPKSKAAIAYSDLYKEVK